MITTLWLKFAAKQMAEKLSFEYIRGLVDGEGCFTFCSVINRGSNGKSIKKKLPAFSLQMSMRDKELLCLVRDTLGLRNRIYEYKSWLKKDKYNRQSMTILIVRDLGQLKNIIVPLFYEKLRGYKRIQFLEWIEKMGTDPDVPENYRLIYNMVKTGFYDRNRKFVD